MSAMRLLLAGLGFAAVSACDPLKPIRVFERERPVVEVVVGPDSAVAAVGDTVTFTATVRGEGDATVREAAVAWTAGDPSVVQPIGEGRFIAVQLGASEVLATAQDKRGRARVVVR